jgi:hypothetical protein
MSAKPPTFYVDLGDCVTANVINQMLSREAQGKDMITFYA